MTLLPNWRAVLLRAWSIKFMLAAALFSGLEVALPLMRDVFPLDPGGFAALAFITTAAAFISRLVAQRNTHEGADHLDSHYGDQP